MTIIYAIVVINVIALLFIHVVDLFWMLIYHEKWGLSPLSRVNNLQSVSENASSRNRWLHSQIADSNNNKRQPVFWSHTGHAAESAEAEIERCVIDFYIHFFYNCLLLFFLISWVFVLKFLLNHVLTFIFGYDSREFHLVVQYLQSWLKMFKSTSSWFTVHVKFSCTFYDISLTPFLLCHSYPSLLAWKTECRISFSLFPVFPRPTIRSFTILSGSSQVEQPLGGLGLSVLEHHIPYLLCLEGDM